MGTNLQDYVELLNAEQHVQVDKLRDNARHGIFANVRGEVWMYLLGVISEDRTQEITKIISLITLYQNLSSTLPSHLTSKITQVALKHHNRRFFNPTYANLITSLTAESPTDPSPTSTMASTAHSVESRQPQKDSELNTIRSQYSRFLPPPPSGPPTRNGYISTVLEVLGKYYHIHLKKLMDRGEENVHVECGGIGASGIEGGDEENWVYLVTPFMCCLSRPGAICLGFEKLMDRLETFPSIPSQLASLLTLFRLAIPDLHSYFEDEQVPYVEIMLCWLTSLLSKEMWLGDVMRLWDAYFASEDMFELHCYVCVAILATCKETLEELDGSEAKLMLLDLPPMDIDRTLPICVFLSPSLDPSLPKNNEGAISLMFLGHLWSDL